MFDSESPDNMLLSGPPGTGKTSTAKIFTEQRGFYGVLLVDGSNETGIENIRNVIEGFASTYAFTPSIKISVIDDADYLSKPAQASLRGLIERSSAHCRFILIVNDVTKIDPAVRSRLLCINFAISKADTPAILNRMQKRIRQILVELGWSFDEGGSEPARLGEPIPTTTLGIKPVEAAVVVKHDAFRSSVRMLIKQDGPVTSEWHSLPFA